MVSTDPETLAAQRKEYYNKWDKFAGDEVSKLTLEEEKEKEEASKALGLDKAPRSEAEKQDMDKHQALKEAKKKWDKVKIDEESKRHVVENLKDVTRTFDSVKLYWKPVISLKNLVNSKITIPKLKHSLIKVFIEGCEGCEIDFAETMITEHLEISHCTNCVVTLHQPLATVQVDLTDGLKLHYKKFEDRCKIYHAAVKDLEVFVDDDSHSHCYLQNTDESEKLREEIQFITQRKNGSFETARMTRDAGNLPTTKEEAKDERTSEREIELKKIGGNEAFKEKNYAQAGIFYTEAIDLAENIGHTETLHIIYANRAFSWQKLGHHEKAEADARKSIELKPDYVKGLFRLGLALHAQKKYFEAVPVLGKASTLEPKNTQIKQALGFAEIQMRKIMAGR